MQILVKSDGFPTYHLAAVVDDHLMGITHILRGEEWLSSMPKHRLIYDRFGWSVPAHYHLPLLRNADGSKVSKRRNPTGLNYYRRMGYLPEALCNYLALMGWSMPDEREIFSTEEMTAAFDIDRLTTGGPVFDLAKLDWLNGQYIRSLAPQEFMDRIAGWAVNRDNLAAARAHRAAAYRTPGRPIAPGRLPAGRPYAPLDACGFRGTPPRRRRLPDVYSTTSAGDSKRQDRVGPRLPADRDSLPCRCHGHSDARLPGTALRGNGRSHGGIAVVRLHGLSRSGHGAVAAGKCPRGPGKRRARRQAKRLERAYAGLDIDAT